MRAAKIFITDLKELDLLEKVRTSSSKSPRKMCPLTPLAGQYGESQSVCTKLVSAL